MLFATISLYPFEQRELMISGIDISDRNGAIDWQLIANGDVHFVYVRATEGIATIDKFFGENVRAAAKHRIPAGPYHWLHPGLHVGQQAELFISAVKNFQGLLPPVVCLETHTAPAEELTKNVKTFLRLLEQRIQIKPVIYTSQKYWQTSFQEAIWGSDYLLWLDQPGKIWPKQMWPWAGWTFWQYSYQSRMPGIHNDVGLNWFNGSQSELLKMVVQ